MISFPAPQQFTAKLSDKKVLNRKFIQYRFELVEPHSFAFVAGQYISFPVSEKGERRSYSICSTPALDHGFEVLVDVTPNGLGVKFFERLQFGDEIKALGPLGRFVIQDDPTEKGLVCIATGSGIAPFRGVIMDLLHDKKDTRDITLYWGLRHVEDLTWQDEFQTLAESFPNFHFHPVLSQAPQEWPLCRGRVTDCLNVHALPAEAGYYLCGNAMMIQDVKANLEQKGVALQNIHHEKFY